MHAALPLTKDLVLVGGGHAHALVLRMWGMNPLPGARLTLVNPGPTAPYSGMLPGHIAGHYQREDLDIDLVRLARFAGARIVLSHAIGIDPAARLIELPGRPPIAYDVASVDVGIHAEMPAIPGFADHAVGAKPLDLYAEAWREFLTAVQAGKADPSVAVIGAGVAGVELALAMAHALKGVTAQTHVTLIEAGSALTGTGPRAKRTLLSALAKAGSALRENAQVKGISSGLITLKDGDNIDARFIVGAAGAFPHRWLTNTPLPLQDGFITVDDNLQVTGHPGLYAVGDCAHMSHAPRPKAGVYAVRAGPVLAHNLRAALSGGRQKPFRPQRDFLKLISLGGKSALAEKRGLALSGPLLWRWKNRIDQKFMDKFRTLPEMAPPAQPREVALGGDDTLKPLCGGCGSKVGAAALSATLSALPRSGRDDIIAGPGDDAAILKTGGQHQVITTDHLRAFTDDPWLMARIAAVHALGDIWAMGATPQAALAQIILPRMAAPLQARTMDEVMQGAGEVFREAGAEIVGGHSSMGPEMTIGFSVTGLSDGKPITNAGAKPGDALVLTRPIGSGTLLAAEMAGAADGRDVAALLTRMAEPQGDAAQLLCPHARAMTDVTGFGLAGHLLNICTASGTGAEIVLASIPVYPGAEELAAAGHRSTLYPANAEATPVIGASGARGALLHDPQTAGGLLAAVDPEIAYRLVTDLRQTGCDAAIIGQLTDRPAELRVV